MQRLLLILGITLITTLTGCSLLAPGQLLFEYTGAKDLPTQIKTLSDLAGGLLRPRLRVDDLQPVQHAHVNPYGVNVFLEQEVEPEKREQAVRMAAEAGFRWLRQEFPWEDIEIHGKGDFEDRRHEPHRSAWEKYDHIVELAERYNMELLVRLSNPPAWTRAEGDAAGTYAPPDNFTDFGDYVHAVVSRYQGRIRYYQLWNEPNIYPEWGEQPVNPEEYTGLLRVGYLRAKAADPNSVIIAGALAATIELTPGPPYGLNDLIFLQRMYDAGAADYFDVMAMQGYGLWSGPTDRRLHPRIMNFSRPQLVRDLMVRNGDGHKAIWISEMNWNAVPDEIPDKRFGQVSLEQQARYLPLAYQRAQVEWPWVGVLNTWYLKRATDQWEREGKPEAYFRLLTPDFEPLPVYHSLREHTANEAPTLHAGFHSPAHWTITATGAWEQQKQDDAPFSFVYTSQSLAAQLTFYAEGEALWLIVPDEDSFSGVRVTVGSGPPHTLGPDSLRPWDDEQSGVQLGDNLPREPIAVTVSPPHHGSLRIAGFVVEPHPALWRWLR